MRINIVNPGAMRTAMRAKAFPGEDPMTLPAPEERVPLILELASPECQRNGEVVNFREWRGAGQVRTRQIRDAFGRGRVSGTLAKTLRGHAVTSE
jgi:NAD(P)-dependent dehydrogenase (short-subunit alcohol dehydrogenase family)